jgi:hypothetical protein
VEEVKDVSCSEMYLFFFPTLAVTHLTVSHLFRNKPASPPPYTQSLCIFHNQPMEHFITIILIIMLYREILA